MKMSDVLKLAKSEVGYKEKKNENNLDDKTANAGSGNYTKYWRDIRPAYQGGAWCQCFINWLCIKSSMTKEEAKISLGFGGHGWTYYTPSAVSYARGNNMFHDGIKGIQCGDIIYFYGYVRSEGQNRVHHVGLVYNVDDHKIYTIEGNAGDGVNYREYSKNDGSLYGYIRPAYEDEISEYEKKGWHYSEGGWWFRHTAGLGPETYYHNCIKEISGVCYGFNKDGYMITDIKKIGINTKGGLYVRE